MILLLLAHLCKGAVIALGLKDRIIAKSVLSPWLLSDSPPDLTLKGVDFIV